MKEIIRRIDKIVPLLLSAVLLLATLTSCQLPDYQADAGIPSEDSYSVDGDDPSKPSAANPNILVTDHIYDDLQSTSIDEVTVYYLGEPALLSSSWNGDKTIRMTITGAEMTQLVGDYEADNFTSLPDAFDGERLTDDSSFLFANIEMANLGEESQVVTTYLTLYYIGDDGFFRGQGGEPIFFDQAKGVTQDYWYVLLEPGETLTAVVGLHVIGGLDLTRGFIPVDLSGVIPDGGTEWFALTERE